LGEFALAARLQALWAFVVGSLMMRPAKPNDIPRFRIVMMVSMELGPHATQHFAAGCTLDQAALNGRCQRAARRDLLAATRYVSRDGEPIQLATTPCPRPRPATRSLGFEVSTATVPSVLAETLGIGLAEFATPAARGLRFSPIALARTGGVARPAY
jgi:hypothetical protein